ncbi:ecdysone oxidase-like isoform X3 [Plodia interpunctella]|uniref:ecdysone oxidase-like isoform X3 n=1 Tax=Plodia interpunctella TaxID=58824 RepID=UPI00310182F8
MTSSLLGVLATLHLTSPLFAPGVQVPNGATFDFIIIGAGTAGGVLANRLAEVEGCNVLVIEAGGDPPVESVAAGAFALLARTEYDWNYTAEYDEAFSLGHINQIMDLTSGRILGGSSSINHLIYSRGFPYDFDTWAEVVDDISWTWDNIYKYFLKLERLEDQAILASTDRNNHGLDGNIGTTREPSTLLQKYYNALEEVGYKALLDTVPGQNDADSKLAFSDVLLFIANLKRQSVAQGYLSGKDAKNNLNILKNTLVTNVIFNEDKVAIGVNVITNDGQDLTFYADKEVILSAGVFNSPKVLLLSGIGPMEDLEALNIPVLSNLAVGENFQDHIGVFIVQKLEKLVEVLPIPSPTQFPLPGMVGYVAFEEFQSYPDYEALNFVFTNSLVFSQICSIVFNFNDHICDSILEQTAGFEFYISLPSLLHPKSRGKVQLKSTHPFDPPIINAGYFSDASDVETLVDIILDNLRISDSNTFKTAGAELIEVNLPACSIHEFGSRDYWRCYVKYMATSHFYYTSTCSMGSVVDAELYVNGVKNLRVVDASVIPFAPSGNPEAIVIVIAEKAADMIKDKYYSPKFGTFQ